MKKTKLLSLIGIIVFIFILTQIDLLKTVSIMLKANASLLAVAVIVNLLIVPLKGLKWKKIIESQKLALGFWQAIKYWLIGFSFSAVTPGRVGDALRAFYLKKEKHPLGKALSTVAIDRLIDIILLFLVACIAIIYFSIAFGIEILSNSLIVLLLAGLIALVYLFWNKRLMKLLLKPLFRIFVPEKYRERMQEYFNDFYEGLFLFQKNKGLLLQSVLLGVIIWLASFGSVYLLALSLGINLPFLYIALIVPIISLLDMIPISISGLGTRETAVVFLLSLKQIAVEQAIAFSLLYFFTGYVLIAALGALVWIKNPIKK